MLLRPQSRRGWLLLIAAIVAIQVLFLSSSHRVSVSDVQSFIRKHIPANHFTTLPDGVVMVDSEDDHPKPPPSPFCQAHYSSAYLSYIGSHHIQYCDSETSQSSLECFRTSTSDSLCIAEGVAFHPNRPSSKNKLALNCQLRNFTLESLDVAESTANLAGVVNIDEMQTYFFATGVKEQLKSWDFEAGEQAFQNISRCSAELNDGSWTLLVRREANSNIFHNVMELWQAKLTLEALKTAVNPTTQQRYFTQEAVDNLQIVLEDDNETFIDEWWTMLSSRPLLRKSSLDATCFGNVILPLAGSSSPFWLGSAPHQDGSFDRVDCYESSLMDDFVRDVYKKVGVKPVKVVQADRPVTITFVGRTTGREIFGLSSKLALLQDRYPDAIIREVEFSKLGLNEQVVVAATTDVLVGVTGAGMTQVLFLPEGASVAEIMPDQIDFEGFGNLARLKDLTYVRVHADPVVEDQVNKVPVVADEKEQAIEGGKHLFGSSDAKLESRSGSWQTEDWVYLSDQKFITLIDEAINGLGILITQ